MVIYNCRVTQSLILESVLGMLEALRLQSKSNYKIEHCLSRLQICRVVKTWPMKYNRQPPTMVEGLSESGTLEKMDIAQGEPLGQHYIR